MKIIYNRESECRKVQLQDLKESLVDIDYLINTHWTSPETNLEINKHRRSWYKELLQNLKILAQTRIILRT